MDPTTIVEWLACWTDIAIIFGFVSETFWTVERTPLSMDTVTGPHVGSDASIRQPLQKLPVPVRGVGRYRFWFSSLPLREASEHVLRSHRFLTHPCCRRLYSHDDATVVVDQIVVVVPQSGRSSTLGGVGRIGIRGRHLFFLMYRFFHRILLFQY